MTGTPSSESKPLSAASAFRAGPAEGMGSAELGAVIGAGLWVLVFLLASALMPDATGVTGWQDPMGALFALLAPVLLLLVVVLQLRAMRLAHSESERLQTRVDQLQTVLMSQGQKQAAPAEPSVAQKLEEIVEAARKSETALATFQTSRREPQREAATPAPPAVEAEDQGALALGTPADDMAPPLAVHQFIRALNFPETADDQDGFVALRLALQDRKAGQVVQAAQDVLTLLSQDGIYMDDLRPDMSRPELWRQFAHGARGKEIAALGGVRDRAALALASARMKQDPIFRDAAHHFLRRFDQMFAEFEEAASDSEISALSETRTARAFMLLGRVAGTFD